MEVTRIIHPIGQGAFYTESIKTNDNLYNVVYDCGSGNHKYTPKRLKQDIASFYNPDDVIDLLFISHFDNDHINGIRELKKRTSNIRNIVVPLIEENDFWYYQIENPSFETFYRSLSEIADSAVYRVKPYNEDEEENNIPINDVAPIILSENGRVDIKVSCTTKFALAPHIDWCYITFNYDQQIRLTKLQNELAIQGITEDILKQGWGIMEQHLKEIKQAYKRVAKDGANNSSLIVYSGGMYNSYNCRRHKIRQPNCNCFGRFEFLESEGCLYLGDTDLNQPKLLGTLINRLNLVIDRISTIQIPHHGAYKNFNPNIMMLNANWQDFFVSFGNTNSYGHPSVKVVSTITRQSNLFAITENRDSVYIQIIKKR